MRDLPPSLIIIVCRPVRQTVDEVSPTIDVSTKHWIKSTRSAFWRDFWAARIWPKLMMEVQLLYHGWRRKLPRWYSPVLGTVRGIKDISATSSHRQPTSRKWARYTGCILGNHVKRHDSGMDGQQSDCNYRRGCDAAWMHEV